MYAPCAERIGAKQVMGLVMPSVMIILRLSVSSFLLFLPSPLDSNFTKVAAAFLEAKGIGQLFERKAAVNDRA